MVVMNATIEQVRTEVYNMLVAKSTLVTDIRELNYQSKSFAYPCIRYEVMCEPDHCDNYYTLLTIYAWSEDPSSLVVTRIMDELITNMHRYTYYGVAIKLQNIIALSAPMIIRDSRLWRGEVRMKCLATS